MLRASDQARWSAALVCAWPMCLDQCCACRGARPADGPRSSAIAPCHRLRV